VQSPYYPDTYAPLGCYAASSGNPFCDASGQPIGPHLQRSKIQNHTVLKQTTIYIPPTMRTSFTPTKNTQWRLLILIIKQTRYTISQIYFWNRTLHVSDSFSVHHQESSTVHTGYVDCLLASSQHNLYDIYQLLFVQCSTPDDGQRNCLKHAEFYSKNKFEKFVHLLGFIIRIYHDARYSECQIR